MLCLFISFFFCIKKHRFVEKKKLELLHSCETCFGAFGYLYHKALYKQTLQSINHQEKTIKNHQGRARAKKMTAI